MLLKREALRLRTTEFQIIPIAAASTIVLLTGSISGLGAREQEMGTISLFAARLRWLDRPNRKAKNFSTGQFRVALGASLEDTLAYTDGLPQVSE